ncbi:hypothetical protein LPLAFNJD_LOCUS1752 [Methylorubrum aminovorans]
MQELRADAVVETDAAGDLLHVGTDLLAEIRDLVDEGDLGGEEGVGGVLGQLGRAPPGEQDRRLVEVERAVDLLHDGGGAGILGADDDAVGPLEVADGRALAQEFGVGGDADIEVGASLAQDALDLVAGADGDGRFGDDHGIAGERLGDLARCGVDVGEVGKAVAAARRGAHRDEHGLGLRHGGSEVCRESEASGADVLGDEGVEAGFVDGHAALVEGFDLVGILVDADDLVAEIGEAGARDEADIARANDRDAHR